MLARTHTCFTSQEKRDADGKSGVSKGGSGSSKGMARANSLTSLGKNAPHTKLSSSHTGMRNGSVASLQGKNAAGINKRAVEWPGGSEDEIGDR